LIRELHVYGNVSKVGNKKSNSQHLGFGTKLLAEAEKISVHSGLTSISVISGIGVRQYYRKRGYIETTKHGYLKKNLINYNTIKTIIKTIIETIKTIFTLMFLFYICSHIRNFR